MGATLRSLLADHREPAGDVDVGRMRRHRHDRLQAELARTGTEVAILLHAPHVTYATGRLPRGVDVTHTAFERSVAVVVAGHDEAHLLAPPVGPELDEGVERLASALAEIAGPLAGRRVAVDVQTGAMLRAGLLAGTELT